jgi:hypothetical protein
MKYKQKEKRKMIYENRAKIWDALRLQVEKADFNDLSEAFYECYYDCKKLEERASEALKLLKFSDLEISNLIKKVKELEGKTQNESN